MLHILFASPPLDEETLTRQACFLFLKMFSGLGSPDTFLTQTMQVIFTTTTVCNWERAPLDWMVELKFEQPGDLVILCVLSVSSIQI